ncbi:MAG: FecR domain-containing protein [Burkholderiaceae bacterium]|nr:FecR domain-containing protein [Burkholderiaceae bacterium]
MHSSLPTRTFLGLALIAGSSLGAVHPALAAEPPTSGDWNYRVAPGDTLIGLQQRFLQAPADWRGLQKLNRVANPRRLMPGSSLRMPVAWLRQDATVAEVIHVQGQVGLQRGQGPASTVAVGDKLLTGDALQAPADGSLTLRFADGSRLLVRPQTRLMLERLMVYGQSEVHETRLQLQQGSLDSQVLPRTGGLRSYQIKTPTVTLGVRGTDFRAQADAQGASLEVLEGRVAASAGGAKPGAERLVEAGYGLRAQSGQAPGMPAKLLPAPSLQGLPTLLERVPLRFAWPALSGATAYRAQVTEPEGGLLLDGRFDSPAARWADLPDGHYRLRVRGIAASGLEGLDAGQAFRLKARPEPPFINQPAANAKVYGDSATLAWTRSTAAARYHLQLSDSGDFGKPRLDLADLTATEHRLALPPGSYHWRVASIRADGDHGPFGDAQAFTQRPVPPSPALEPPQISADKLLLRWQAQESGTRFEFQLAADAEFKQVLQQQTSAEPQITLARPPAGQYFLRVRSIDADGFVGPFGGTQQIAIPRSPWWLAAPLLLLLLAL